MKYPNLREEIKLRKRGYKCVAGLDEVGRGPLAGPVVASAVVFDSKFKTQDSTLLKGIRDSKKLTAKQRDKFYRILNEHPNIKWGIGMVSEKIIDKINIFEATKLAMIKAIKNLKEKYPHPDFLILDGNFTLDLPLPQRSIVKADEKVFSCAAASIFAKVIRDRFMEKCHKKYPHYGFSRHKGYPTDYHIKMLEKHGPCPLHRKTFSPVNKLV